MTSAPVITIDGPSGTGKGALAMTLTRWLGWHLLDSGALYRLVGLDAVRQGIPLDDETRLAGVADRLPAYFEIVKDALVIYLDGRDVTTEIRAEEAGAAASQVAALPRVRAALLERQRAFQQPPGLIADGRDMGTIVFPHAALKIFLTASPEVRAERRYKQLKEKGIGVNLRQLMEDIRSRDQRDEQRAVSPLQPAPDAEILDTTMLGISEVEDHVKRLIRERSLAQRAADGQCHQP